jgi:hypothetical protein
MPEQSEDAKDCDVTGPNSQRHGRNDCERHHY